MIRTILLQPGKPLQTGGVELIQHWQQNSNALLWLDLQDENEETEQALLEAMNCHEMAIASSQAKRPPPKIEAFDEHLLLIYRGISSLNNDLDIEALNIALFFNDRMLVSRHNGVSFSIEHWMNQPAELSELLQQPAELAVAIMHYSFNRYLDALLTFESKLSDIEDTMQSGGDDEELRQLVLYKSRLRRLNRVFRYHEEVAEELLEEEWPFLRYEGRNLQHACRLLYDRCKRLNSLGSMYYEICGDLIEGYLSLTSHQLNQTMKILTVITAIFVPLGFLAGLYGMNFEYMPELGFRYAYFVLLGMMVFIAGSLIWLFRRRGWLNG